MTAPAAVPSRGHHVWALCALLVLVTAAVFARALSAEFVAWDDDINIYANPHHGGLEFNRLVWMFTDSQYVRYYAPLAWLALAVIYEGFGLNPLGYHLANLLLHCANVVLLFAVIRRLLALGSPRSASAQGTAWTSWCAAIAALLWGLNPLRVEPVAWATGISYCLALCFLLLSLWCLLRAKSPGNARRSQGLWSGLSVAGFVASLLAYPIGLAWLMVLVALDFYLFRTPSDSDRPSAGGRLRRLAKEALPFAIVTLALVAFNLYRRATVQGFWDAPLTLEQFGLASRLMQAFYLWAYYLWKPWWPVDLSPLYTTLMWFKPTDWPFVLSLGLVLGLSLVLVWHRRRRPGLLALWICHLALLVPLLGLTEHPHYPNDRYSYLVNTLWSVLLAAALCRVPEHGRWRAWVGAGCLVLAAWWGLLSARQTLVWRNSVALFEHALEHLGSNRYRGDIHWRLGRVLAAQNQLDRAEAHFSAALESLPLFPDAHSDLAVALEQRGQIEEALSHYEAALRIQPTADRHAALAMALARHGRTDAAIGHYREALRLKPDAPGVLNNLAWILAASPDARLRNGPEAVALAEQACKLTGFQQPKLVGTLAAAHAEAGRFAEAVTAAEQAISLAKAAGDTNLWTINERLLQVYRQGRAYHEDPAKPR